MEAIREHLGLEQWLLFAGSWGSTLALLYAEQYPQRVSGIVSRGTFLARQQDLDWYIKDGVNRIYPERWAELLAALHGAEGDLIAAFHAILHGEDELAQRRAARAWWLWGGQIALGDEFNPTEVDNHVSAQVLHQARIELHYGFHRYFLSENQILDNSALIPPVPVILIHGRRDLVCPVEAAFTLQQHLPFAELRIIPTAGHIASTPEMTAALVEAADEMATRLGA
jgi:proline iminopeptidase